MAKTNSPFDPSKVENTFQIGGIQTGSIDYPQPNGGQSCRVAFVDTGSGLRFTVALDRGGDIVEASYKGCSLAYLGPNGYKPPNHAYHADFEWLSGWPGGLVTTCGPVNMGLPTQDDPHSSLHGHHSNTPASVRAVTNPQPRRNRWEMSIELTVRDSRFFGPNVELQRRISCRLGEPAIDIQDQVTNVGDATVPHQQLYHVNFGYPLVDAGARMIYGGRYDNSWDLPADGHKPANIRFPGYKRVPGSLAAHTGHGERGLIVQPSVARGGKVRVGLINSQRHLAVEMSYSKKQLPWLANWQHFGPNGCYVTALEPFNGSLRPDDTHAGSRSKLKPGQSSKYDLTLRVHEGRTALAELARCDADLTGAPA